MNSANEAVAYTAPPEYSHRMGKDHCSAGLPVNKIGFDQTKKMLLFVCFETCEFNPVKLEGAPQLSRTFYFLDKILGPGAGFTDKILGPPLIVLKNKVDYL